MKKIVLFVCSSLLITSLFAQDKPQPDKKNTQINLSNRANDHLLVQIGYTAWAGKPDSIKTGGFPKSINVYFMFDFPFKNNPKLSMAFGPGIASDGIKFEKTYVDIKANTPTLRFVDQADTNHFKRNKLGTTYLEAPIEFRWVANPFDSDKSFKWAIGVKAGYMIDAHTRYKTYQNEAGNTINDYKMKEAQKKFFNAGRLSGTARVGWGHFSLYGSYQITNLFKEGVAAEIHPYSIGLTLSGL